MLERAKGALMLRYGTDAERAGAILVSWQRQLAPATVANLLLAAICEGSSVRPDKQELVRRLQDHDRARGVLQPVLLGHRRSVRRLAVAS